MRLILEVSLASNIRWPCSQVWSPGREDWTIQKAAIPPLFSIRRARFLYVVTEASKKPGIRCQVSESLDSELS